MNANRPNFIQFLENARKQNQQFDKVLKVRLVLFRCNSGGSSPDYAKLTLTAGNIDEPLKIGKRTERE